MRVTVGLSILAVVLASVGAVMIAADRTEEHTFCNADALLVDGVPPGWEFRHDHANNCEWTLFNGLGERAPDELYATVPLDPPPVPSATGERPRDIGWFVAGLAGVALVASLLWPSGNADEGSGTRDVADAIDR